MSMMGLSVWCVRIVTLALALLSLVSGVHGFASTGSIPAFLIGLGMAVFYYSLSIVVGAFERVARRLELVEQALEEQ